MLARELGGVPPEPSDAAGTTDADARGGLAVHEVVVGVGCGASRGGDRGVERPDRAGLRVREPRGLRVRRGDGDEEADVAPRERPLGEGGGDGGQLLEPLRHAGELLELAAGEAEALARPVVEPGEAEALLGAALEERTGEAAEDAAAERLLAAEAAEEPVEDRRRRVPVEVAPLSGRRRDEELGRYDVVHGRRRLDENATGVN
jgi:hypothetical protein